MSPPDVAYVETLKGLCEARPIDARSTFDVASRFASRVGLVRVRSSSMAFSRRLDAVSRGVDHVALHVLTSGTMMWRQPEQPRKIAAVGVVLTDLASEFGCASGEQPAEWLILLVNRHQIGSELLAPLSDRPTILDASRPLVSGLGALLAGYAENAWNGEHPHEDLDALGDGATAILQTVLRDGRGQAAARYQPVQSKIVQLCRYIDENLGSARLAPELLAPEFGLSRASLYRMFEPIGGVSRYIRLQKIARATAEMQKAGRHVPLSVIAQSAGFTSPDAFVRAFRESYGTTPREYRSLQGGGRVVAEMSLAAWLERNYFWRTNTTSRQSETSMAIGR
jgi:AraC-like DNA-binding protein